MHVPKGRFRMNTGSTKEELIEKLYQLIEYELNKPDAEADAGLIAECADYLEELQAGEVNLSDEEILSRLEAIQAPVAAKSSLSTEKTRRIPHEKRRHPLFLKIFVPIAATFFALFLAITVVAYTNGTTLGNFLSENLKKISLLSKGDAIKDDDISAIKTEITTYQSFEEFIDSLENVSFLFPEPLPEGLIIQKIQQFQADENHLRIVFFFDNQNLVIKIKNYYQMNYSSGTYLEEIENNDLYFFVYFLDGSYLVSGQYNGYEYNFESPNLNLLKQLIENIKEIKT